MNAPRIILPSRPRSSQWLLRSSTLPTKTTNEFPYHPSLPTSAKVSYALPKSLERTNYFLEGYK